MSLQKGKCNGTKLIISKSLEDERRIQRSKLESKLEHAERKSKVDADGIGKNSAQRTGESVLLLRRLLALFCIISFLVFYRRTLPARDEVS